MHVVIIIPRFYPYWGGAEIHMQELAEALMPRDFKFTVLTRKLSRDVPNCEELSGIMIHRFPKSALLFNFWVRFWLKKNNQIYQARECYRKLKTLGP